MSHVVTCLSHVGHSLGNGIPTLSVTCWPFTGHTLSVTCCNLSVTCWSFTGHTLSVTCWPFLVCSDLKLESLFSFLKRNLKSFLLRATSD